MSGESERELLNPNSNENGAQSQLLNNETDEIGNPLACIISVGDDEAQAEAASSTIKEAKKVMHLRFQFKFYGLPIIFNY